MRQRLYLVHLLIYSIVSSDKFYVFAVDMVKGFDQKDVQSLARICITVGAHLSLHT